MGQVIPFPSWRREPAETLSWETRDDDLLQVLVAVAEPSAVRLRAHRLREESRALRRTARTLCAEAKRWRSAYAAGPAPSPRSVRSTSRVS